MHQFEYCAQNAKTSILRMNLIGRYVLLLYFVSIAYCLSKFNRLDKRSIIYPQFSVMGLFAAIAVPVDIMDNSVFFSYNFEGVYYVPRNLSDLEYMPFYVPVTKERKKRSLNRETAYKILENQLSRLGYPGRACLLRAICEIAHMPLSGNGVLGDVLQVIFTPSASSDEDLSMAFYIAEKKGEFGYCQDYIEKCSSSFLDKISIIE